MKFFYLFLAVTGTVVAVIAWIRGINWFHLKMSGWPDLIAQFPSPASGQVRETYKSSDGAVGRLRLTRGFRIDVLDDGLKVTPHFARRFPLFVPWSRVFSVESAPFSIRVKLDSDTWFHLPKEAFDSVRSKVRQEVLK